MKMVSQIFLRPRFWFGILLCVFSLGLVSCNKSLVPAEPTRELQVVASQSLIEVESNIALSASVLPLGTSASVSWVVDGGTLSAAAGNQVTYTAPQIPGNYTIRATANDGRGDLVKTVAIQVVNQLMPSTPVGLRVTAAGDNFVTLTWEKNPETFVDHYHVTYRPEYESAFLHSLNDISTTNLTISNLSNRTRYYFQVAAVSASGRESVVSIEQNAIPMDPGPPGTPIHFTATQVGPHVSLSWVNPSDMDLVGVKILRRTLREAPLDPNDPTSTSVPISASAGANIPSKSITIEDSNPVVPGTYYYYYIYAYDEVPNTYSPGSLASVYINP